MAIRNSRARRVPGNPLGGILRDLSHSVATLSTRRLPKPYVAPKTAGGTGSATSVAPAATPVAAPATTYATYVTTSDEGMATFAFEEEMASQPVFAVTPMSATPVSVTVSDVSQTGATFYAWEATGEPVPDVTLHVVATPTTIGHTPELPPQASPETPPKTTPEIPPQSMAPKASAPKEGTT